MDIEWVLHDGHVSVVQARPITALPEPVTGSQVARAEEWKLPNPKGHYYRASVIELLPDPLSPLFATLGLPAWARATAGIFGSLGLANVFPDEILTTINGYGYYSMSLTPVQTAKMTLAVPRILAAFLPLLRTSEQRWQKARSRYAGVVDYWQTRDLATTSAINLLGGAHAITDEAAEYYLTVQGGILPGAYMSEALFALMYNRFIKRRDAPSALTFMLGFDSAPIQSEKSLYDIAQWVREQPELVARLSNISSVEFASAFQAEQMAGIDEETWSGFRQRFAAHLERFGGAIYDLDFAKAVPAEDPASLLETLKFFLSGDAPNPYLRQEKAASAREEAKQSVLARLRGPRLALFRRLVGWARSFAPLREDALANAGLGWSVLRHMLREIGQRLVTAHSITTADDIFWLTLDEVQASAYALDNAQNVEPVGDYHTAVAERRAAWERERKVTPPAALPLTSGYRFLGIDFSVFPPARIDQPTGNVLKGIAASPGRVTGPARVIHGPEEFEHMRPGDILVARITTPAWTPLFALASGVVTEVGGPLSHSSIVAREYHIPAVLGTGVATERIRNGQRIVVVGDAGLVETAGSRA